MTPTIETLQRYARGLDMDLGIPQTASSLGRQLRKRRQTNGLTLDAVSLDLGGRHYLTRIEQGEFFPSLEVYLRLATRLEFPLGPILESAIIRN